ncbi:MAG: SBBP repeat-containing protein [Pseudomonadota bacterium]
MKKKSLSNLVTFILIMSFLISCSGGTSSQGGVDNSASVADDSLVGVWTQNTSDANALKTMTLTKTNVTNSLSMDGNMGNNTQVKGVMVVIPSSTAKAAADAETATAILSFYDTGTNGAILDVTIKGAISLSADCKTLTIDDSQNNTTTTFTSTKTSCSDTGTVTQPTTPGAQPANCINSDIPAKINWARQIGSTNTDFATSICMDKTGNVYMAGHTLGSLDNNQNAGGADIFLVKHDSSGNKIWLRQIGTASKDLAAGVAADLNENIYMTGYTQGGLDNNQNAGDYDIFVMKFDALGNKLWTRQMGTNAYDASSSIAVDSSGNVYIAGKTNGALDGQKHSGLRDIFLIKLDSSGNKLWTRLSGTAANDEATGVAVDSTGNAYVTGMTEGALDGNQHSGFSDIFVMEFDPSGNKLWTEQRGTALNDNTSAIAVDSSGNSYVCGRTEGGLSGNQNAGLTDIFLIKLDSAGNDIWTKQFGTTQNDSASGIATDMSNNIYVTGNTDGGVDNYNNMGFSDIFTAKIDPSSGNPVWIFQTGSPGGDEATGITIDSGGSIYVAGHTDDDLYGNKNAGIRDAFAIALICN